MVAIALPLDEPVYIICLLLLSAWIAPIIALGLRLPSLVILILLGAVLGTNFLGILERDAQLILLEKVGLLLIMFIAGIQMNLNNLRELGTRALLFGLLTFSIPIIIGFSISQFLGYGIIAAVLFGTMYSPHTLMSYPIVSHLGVVDREAISVTVGGTVITSILTLIFLSVVQGIQSGSIGALLWVKLLVLLPLFSALCLWGLPNLGKLVFNNYSKSSTAQLIFVLASLFTVSSAIVALGVDAIVGAFIAGLALNSLVPSTSPLMEDLEIFANSLFIPTFMISVGVLMNPWLLFDQPQNLAVALVIIVGAVGAKFLAAGLAGWIFHYSWDEVMIMLGLTVSRSALVLVIALYGQNVGLLDDAVFNNIVVYIIVTCLAGPLVVNIFAHKLARQ